MLIARTYDSMRSVLCNRIMSYQKGFFLTSLDSVEKAYLPVIPFLIKVSVALRF